MTSYYILRCTYIHLYIHTTLGCLVIHVVRPLLRCSGQRGPALEISYETLISGSEAQAGGPTRARVVTDGRSRLFSMFGAGKRGRILPI